MTTSEFERIDAHHHLWKYDSAEYGWISDDMRVLRKNYLPPDLKMELQRAGISRTVAIQARQTLEETQFLLAQAQQYPFIAGVVGWAPLTEAGVAHQLEALVRNPQLKGLRHVLQDEADANFILRDDFNRGIAELKRFDLAYDILIFERHLPQTITFVDKHPGQRFVVDHLAKPQVKAGAISPWRDHLIELAKRPHVYCKISGLATEADHSTWTKEALTPYIDVVLSAFGPSRVMFGSDWPVCLLAIPYSRWVEIVDEETSQFSPDERARIWGGTAREAYRL